MDSRTYARLRLDSAIGWRVLVAICLFAASVEVTKAHYYFLSLIAGGALYLTLLDLFLIWRRGSLGVVEGRDASPNIERRLASATALLDAVTVALFAVDADGRVSFTNRAGRRLAGWEVGRLDDIKGLGPVEVAGILALPAGGRQLVTLSDGRTMLVWVSLLAIPDNTGRRITSRLVSMQAVAGELDAVQVAAWHTMTRVLAHEMMNSLTPVVSLADSLATLTAQAPDPRLRDAAETIARRSRHLMDFVERYRAVVDLPEPKFEDIDVDAMLAGIKQLKSAELERLGIEFVVTREGNASIPGDQTLIEQALLNLIKNAAEAVGEAANPRVELICVDGAQSMIFWVKDNGVGIEGQQEAVFVPFYTTKTGGAGIGLTFVRQVALAHGGRATAIPQAEGGVVFELAIPRRRPSFGSPHLDGRPPGSPPP